MELPTVLSTVISVSLSRKILSIGMRSVGVTEAELVSLAEFHRKKMLLIHALGTNGYYSRFGYTHDGPYVSKNIVQQSLTRYASYWFPLKASCTNDRSCSRGVPCESPSKAKE